MSIIVNGEQLHDSLFLSKLKFLCRLNPLLPWLFALIGILPAGALSIDLISIWGQLVLSFVQLKKSRSEIPSLEPHRFVPFSLQAPPPQPHTTSVSRSFFQTAASSAPSSPLLMSVNCASVRPQLTISEDSTTSPERPLLSPASRTAASRVSFLRKPSAHVAFDNESPVQASQQPNQNVHPNPNTSSMNQGPIGSASSGSAHSSPKLGALASKPVGSSPVKRLFSSRLVPPLALATSVLASNNSQPDLSASMPHRTLLIEASLLDAFSSSKDAAVIELAEMLHRNSLIKVSERTFMEREMVRFFWLVPETFFHCVSAEAICDVSVLCICC